MSALSQSVSVFDGPPEKLAETLPKVHDLIRARWSPRCFSAREVSAEDLRTVLDAARWAASSFNEQPWRFIVAQKSDPEGYNKILHLLVEQNQKWAQSAPVLMIMAAKRTFSHNSAPNRYAIHDTGAALATLALQATALGLHVHGMAGFDYERARVELGIPPDFDLGSAAALGYVDSPDKLPEGLRQAETAKRTRKPLNELVFSTKWGNPLPLDGQ